MGRVYGPYGDAMSGARVSLVRPNGDVVAETETSHDGHFEVARVPTGSYRLKAKYRGFKDVDTRVIVSRTKTAFVPLLMPLTALADDGASISGVVPDQSGAPAANVSVCLHVPFAACNADLAVTTDRSGRFDVPAPRHLPRLLSLRLAMVVSGCRPLCV